MESQPGPMCILAWPKRISTVAFVAGGKEKVFSGATRGKFTALLVDKIRLKGKKV